MKLMERRNRKKILGSKGFTFVELVVTIALMSVLLGFVGMKFSGYIELGREAKDEEIFDRFAMAAVQYYSSHLDDFAKVREEQGIIAFTVFYVKQYYTPAAPKNADGSWKDPNVSYTGNYPGFTGARSDDFSFGIQRLTGYYMEDEKNPDNYLESPDAYDFDYIRSTASRDKLKEDLASKVSTGLTEIRIEFNFATRTVHVQTGFGGDNTTGDGREYYFYDKYFNF